MITAFRDIRRWAKVLEEQRYVDIDEREFYNLFRGRRAKVASWCGRKQPRCFFREAYSTPGATDQMRWTWRDGQLTNEFYPFNSFMYLHFMSWHNNRWLKEQPGLRGETHAAWSRLGEIVQMDWRDARKHGFAISPAGIQRLA